MITENYIQLQPAYGKDYKNKAEIEKAFKDGKDFEGGYQINFKLCSIRDFAKGVKVELRYAKLTKAHIVTV